MKAWLTHSFHCCAFKFPQRHDPESYKKHQELVDNFKSECVAKGYSHTNDNDNLSYYNNGINFSSDINQIRKRRRRQTVNTYIVEDAENNITFPYSSDSNSQDGDDIDGEFHEPLKFSNISLEAMCGNISIK